MPAIVRVKIGLYRSEVGHESVTVSSMVFGLRRQSREISESRDYINEISNPGIGKSGPRLRSLAEGNPPLFETGFIIFKTGGSKFICQDTFTDILITH